MQKVTDPVCGMSIDPETAAGKSEFEGQDYYFCSVACKKSFDENPSKFVAAGAGSAEPPYTRSGGIVSPKFGSAGSGGAEYEPLPGDKRPG